MVPIKGADDETPRLLECLVKSEVPGSVEYLFTMESKEDPAYVVCREIQATYPNVAIHLVLSGPAGRLMGKQHNLAAASRTTRYEVIGSTDADVLVDVDTLTKGLEHLSYPDTGVAYFLPVYRGSGQFGGTLVATYCNYYYNLYMGAWAASRNAPFIVGALWLMRRSTFDQTDGFVEFGQSVSDDALIGRAVHNLGLRNVLVPHTVTMPLEKLDLWGGIRHLRKWLGMLRAEGLLTILTVWLLWHPIFWALVTVAIGFWTGEARYLVYGVGLIGAAVGARLITTVLLGRSVYGQSGWQSSLSIVAYELLAVPLLFMPGLFIRTIKWKGRYYRLGKGGRIMDTKDE